MSVNPWGEAQAAKLKVKELEKRIANLESDLLSSRITFDDEKSRRLALAEEGEKALMHAADLRDEIKSLKADLAKYQVPAGSPIPCPACSEVGMFVNPGPLMSFYRVEGAAPIGRAVGVGTACLACGSPVRITKDGAVLAAPKKPAKEAPQNDGPDSYQRDLKRLGR